MPVPYLLPRSSITERSQSRRPSGIWRPPALPCAWRAVPDPHSRVFDQGAPIVIRRRAKVGVARPSPCAAAAVEISVPRAHSRLRRGPGASSRLSTPIYREHQGACLVSHRERRLPERRTIPIFSSPTVARRAALWRDQATPGEQSGRCLPPPHFFGLISLGARRTQRR